MGTLRMLQRQNTMTCLHGECRSQETVRNWGGASTGTQLMQPRADSRDLTNDVTHKAQGNDWLAGADTE